MRMKYIRKVLLRAERHESKPTLPPKAQRRTRPSNAVLRASGVTTQPERPEPRPTAPPGRVRFSNGRPRAHEYHRNPSRGGWPNTRPRKPVMLAAERRERALEAARRPRTVSLAQERRSWHHKDVLPDVRHHR